MFLANEKQVAHIANEVARIHVLRTLDEIEMWVKSGNTIEQYLLVKRNLFTTSNN